MVGGSSTSSDDDPAALIGHLNVILPPADRDAGFAPTALAETSKPNNLNDGHDYIKGNEEDDTLLGDNGFVDRYLGAGGAWFTVAGPGGGPLPADRQPEPGAGTRCVDELRARPPRRRDQGDEGGPARLRQRLRHRRRRARTTSTACSATTGSRATTDEDAIVGDMGKVVDNQLGPPAAGFPPDGFADPSPLNQFIAPQQPFLGSTINYTGMLKREVTLYAFNEDQPATAGVGHDVALGGAGNDSIHTGPGEDLANGNAGDDHIWLGDNFTQDHRGEERGAAQARPGPRRRGLGRRRPRPPLGWLRCRLPRRPAAHDGGGAGPLPGQRSGDVVPDRGRASRRRTACVYGPAGQLRGHRLHLRRLGSGHPAGQRG